VPGLDLKRFWRYSLHTAVGAKWIAKKAGENTDLAFTIGMMHAIGQLVIHAGMPAEAQELDKDWPVFTTAAAWRRSKKPRWASISARSVPNWPMRWKFPAMFRDTIAQLPRTDSQQSPPNRMAGRDPPGRVARAGRRERSSGQTRTQLAASLPACDCGSAWAWQADHPAGGDAASLSELSAGLDELIH
jgi:hypothetical protein